MPTSYVSRNITLNANQKKELSKALQSKTPIVLRFNKDQLSSDGTHAIPLTTMAHNKIEKNLLKRGGGTEVKFSKSLLAELQRRLKSGDTPLDGIIPDKQVTALKPAPKKKGGKVIGLNPPGVTMPAVMDTPAAMPTEAVSAPTGGNAKKPRAKYVTDRGLDNIGAHANPCLPPDDPPQKNHSTGTGCDSAVGKKKKRPVPDPRVTISDPPILSGV